MNLFIFDLGEQKGPYALEQLLHMREHGELTPDALWWDDESSQWLRLADKLGEGDEGTAQEQDSSAASPMAPAFSAEPAREATPPPLPAWVDLPFKAPSGLRRCIAFFIDVGLFSALGTFGADAAQKMKIVIADPWASIIGVSFIVAAIGFRDIAFGGRSLGRRLTMSYLMNRQTLAPASHWTSLRRNLMGAGLVIAPCVIAVLLGTLVEAFLGGTGRAIGFAALGGMIAVIKSADNPTGQGWWDSVLDTVVVCKAGPHDARIPTGPKGEG